MSKRNKTPQRVPAGVPIDDYFAKQMADPEYAREYEALAPEFEIIEQQIKQRVAKRAKKTGGARN